MSTTASQWYYLSRGERRGPVSETDLRQLMVEGAVNTDTPVWTEGMQNWEPLRSTRLAQHLQSSPPPVPPAHPSNTARLSHGLPTGQGSAHSSRPSYWAGFFLNILIWGSGYLVIREYTRAALWFFGGVVWAAFTSIILPNVIVARERAQAIANGTYLDPDVVAMANGLSLIVWWLGGVVLVVAMLLSYRNLYRRKYGA